MRFNELDEEKNFVHKLDSRQKAFLKKESELCKTTFPFWNYLNDLWNIYDFLSIIFLLLVFFIHLADISNHTSEISVVYIRTFSLAIIFISIDIFKIARVLNEVRFFN